MGWKADRISGLDKRNAYPKRSGKQVFSRDAIWLSMVDHTSGKNIYAAVGNSGNVIYVNPEKNIVIAISSFFKPTVFDRVDFIEEILLPCFG